MSAKQSPDSHCFAILQATRRHSPALYFFAPGAAHSNRVTPIRKYCTLQAERQVKHPGKVKNPEIIKRREHNRGGKQGGKETMSPLRYICICARSQPTGHLKFPSVTLLLLLSTLHQELPGTLRCVPIVLLLFPPLTWRFFSLSSVRVTCYFTINEERKGYAPNLSFRLTAII